MKYEVEYLTREEVDLKSTSHANNIKSVIIEVDADCEDEAIEKAKEETKNIDARYFKIIN